jgi:hypothetical protein
MIKVAMLTMQRSLNYGAVLQSYALQQTICRFGVHCEILDLLRPVHEGYRSSPRSAALPPYCITSGLSRPSMMVQIKGHVRRLLEIMIDHRRHQRFRRFDQEYLTYSSNSFQCVDDLYAASLDYDAYVTGSDQVWNPTYPYSPEPYFLTFARLGLKRIAYAPSFGVSQLDVGVHDQYRAWLNGINQLSVRERHGAAIIKELTGRQAEVVLDPTLLLTESDWSMIAKNPKTRKPYIFCYNLGDNPDIMTLCRHLQLQTGFRIYSLGNHLRHPVSGVNGIVNAGPQEFLGWIKNAAVVVTDSFHGTVLSVNMRKPFFIIPGQVWGRNSRNSRLESILEILDLKDRVWTQRLPLPSTLNINFDYCNTERLLIIERIKSLRFLRDAIMDDGSIAITKL